MNPIEEFNINEILPIEEEEHPLNPMDDPRFQENSLYQLADLIFRRLNDAMNRMAGEMRN